MKQSTQRFINRPFIRTLVALLAFVLIASCLDMFWKKSSQRSRGAELTQAVQKPEKRDRVVTAHFMVGLSRCSHKPSLSDKTFNSSATRTPTWRRIGRKTSDWPRKRACKSSSYMLCRRTSRCPLQTCSHAAILQRCFRPQPRTGTLATRAGTFSVPHMLGKKIGRGNGQQELQTFLIAGHERPPLGNS